MTTVIVHEEPPDWEERHRNLMVRQQTFVQLLCKELNLEWQVSSENDILSAVRKLVPAKEIPA